MTDYNARAEKYRSLVEARLEMLTRGEGIHGVLSDAMRYSVLGGGKRLRAMLTLESARISGADADIALDFAAAIEMIHAYSLIHDDLPAMDNDDIRRGKPSNHKVFGEGMAVLAGDGLLNLAYETLLARCSSHAAANAAAIIARGAGVTGMITGQAADITGMGGSIDDLKYIHAHKTGALILSAVLAGAALGKCTNYELSAFESFGREFGLLFQMTDDILDVCGESTVVGKTLGKDADENKLTYPAVFGVERSRKLAAETARRAVDALAVFGGGGEWLEETVRRTLVRTK